MLKLIKAKFTLLSLIITLSFGFLFADWIDDLSSKVFDTKSWNQEYKKVLDKYIKEDQEKIVQIQAKIDELKSDFWSSFKYSAYYLELKTVKTEKEYHEKVVLVLSDLHQNKNDREKLVKKLIDLHEGNLELENLNSKVAEGSNSDKAKIYLKIAAKNTEIIAKKGLIKGFFLV